MAEKAPWISLPTDWPKHVKSGVLHVIALARVCLLYISSNRLATPNAIQPNRYTVVHHAGLANRACLHADRSAHGSTLADTPP